MAKSLPKEKTPGLSQRIDVQANESLLQSKNCVTNLFVKKRCQAVCPIGELKRNRTVKEIIWSLRIRSFTFHGI